VSLSSPVDVKPLALGELVDRAASFWRVHARRLFQVFLISGLVQYALLKAVIASAPILSRPSIGRAPPDFGELIPAVVGMFGIFIVSAWISWCVLSSVAPYCWGQLTGAPVTLGAALRAAVARLGRVTLAYVLSLFQLFVALLLLPLVGVGIGILGARLEGAGGIVLALFGVLLATLGALAALLWYVLRFMVMPQVLALEPGGLRDALKRSNALVSGRIGPGLLGLVKLRATIVMTAVFAIWTTASVLTSLPALIVQTVYGHIFDPAHADPSAIPQLLLIPAELVSQAAQSFLSPLYLAFTTLFYLDMRVRREGLDLALRLQRASCSLLSSRWRSRPALLSRATRRRSKRSPRNPSRTR